jgi:DNA-binding transcriptional MerR regulator
VAEIEKSPNALRTIREVSDELGLEPYVLRFWEKEFKQIQPMQRSNGRRYYRPEDIQVIRQVQALLHDQGYTIKGARAVLAGEVNAEPAEKTSLQDALNQLHQRIFDMRQQIADVL